MFCVVVAQREAFSGITKCFLYGGKQRMICAVINECDFVVVTQRVCLCGGNTKGMIVKC